MLPENPLSNPGKIELQKYLYILLYCALMLNYPFIIYTYEQVSVQKAYSESEPSSANYEYHFLFVLAFFLCLVYPCKMLMNSKMVEVISIKPGPLIIRLFVHFFLPFVMSFNNNMTMTLNTMTASSHARWWMNFLNLSDNTNSSYPS